MTDLERALAFYQGVLGFRPVFTNGDPVSFVILVKDEAELHLNRRPRCTPTRRTWPT